MRIEAPGVSSYIAQAPAARQAALERLRSLCREELSGYEECIEYGMPGYKKSGVLEVSFASQKQYISLYVMKGEIVDRYRAALPDCSIGKGCIRFKKADRMDFPVIRELLRSKASERSATH